MGHPEFSCLKDWGGDHDSDGTPNWRDPNFWTGKDSCSAPWAMDEEFDYTNPDKDLSVTLNTEAEKIEAKKVLGDYFRNKLNIEDGEYIDNVILELVDNNIDVDGSFGDDFLKLFYGEYTPGTGWSQIKDPLDPGPTKFDFDEILELAAESGVSTNSGQPVASPQKYSGELSFVDQNGDGWLGLFEGRKDFEESLRNFFMQNGFSEIQAKSAASNLPRYDLNDNGVADVLDKFYDSNGNFIIPEDLGQIVWDYSNIDYDLLINALDIDNNGNLVSDTEESWNTEKWGENGRLKYTMADMDALNDDYDRDGNSDVLESTMGTDPSSIDRKFHELASPYLKVFDANTPVEDAEVIMFAYAHGRVGTEAGDWGDFIDKEISKFIEAYYSQTGNKIVVLLEGIEGGKEIDWNNPEIAFGYSGNSAGIKLDGWDNDEAGESSIVQIGTLLRGNATNEEYGYPNWESDHVDNSTVQASYDAWTEYGKQEEIRNASLIDAIEKYQSEGYTVIVTAGTFHYSNAPVVREALEDYKYVVITENKNKFDQTVIE